MTAMKKKTVGSNHTELPKSSLQLRKKRVKERSVRGNSQTFLPSNITMRYEKRRKNAQNKDYTSMKFSMNTK